MVSWSTGLAGLTTTASPSSATLISYGWNPFFLASAISFSLMFRELIAMSQVPLMRLESPVPEPPPVTAMKSSGCFSMYLSAHAWPRLTIVSEPLI